MALSQNFFPLLKPAGEIPECEKIGILASKRGNFSLARQMFKLVIKDMEGQDDQQDELLRMTMEMAGTYEREGSFTAAKEWYNKAFLLWERLKNREHLQGACIMAKLALVSVFQKDLRGFQTSFERLERAYLLTNAERTAPLLSILIDLSWALCLQRHTQESRAVNELVDQLQQEELLLAEENTEAGHQM